MDGFQIDASKYDTIIVENNTFIEGKNLGLTMIAAHNVTIRNCTVSGNRFKDDER